MVKIRYLKIDEMFLFPPTPFPEGDVLDKQSWYNPRCKLNLKNYQLFNPSFNYKRNNMLQGNKCENRQPYHISEIVIRP